MLINDIHERLTTDLLHQNDCLSYGEARVWVEVLWEDFETTRAKAGYGYHGYKMTENIVRSWIKNYGGKLHEFKETNTKISQLLQAKKHRLH